jgi:hypothetical protein
MNKRPYWLQLIETSWETRSIVWLSGVRRVGKTTLAGMLPDAAYLNCDLPSVGRMLADPESFYDGLKPNTRIVFDEVHRLDDPSRVLKIAADAYPHLKVLATGSSTLAATRKFRDSLTGRKRTIYLPPVLWAECMGEFNVTDLDRRLLHGGLPEALLATEKQTAFYSEWLVSFYARDIQELFGIRNRSGFMKLLHLLLRQSGGLIDYSGLAQLAELSRQTVKAHIEAMAVAHAVYLLPPFHGGGRRELTRRPKCYAFDTGLVTFIKGWDSIREEDRGLLWEHLVLDTLRSETDDRNLYFWRDKSGREVDFVIKRGAQYVDAIECKINPDRFEPDSTAAFRESYAEGDNYVISPYIKTPYQRRYGELTVRFRNMNQLSWRDN